MKGILLFHALSAFCVDSAFGQTVAETTPNGTHRKKPFSTSSEPRKVGGMSYLFRRSL
jgi:hypothetical protein